MTEEEITTNAKEVKDRGRLVEQLLSSSGWKIYQEVKNKKLQELCDISKLQTVKDLEVAKKLQKVVKEIEEDLVGIVDDAVRADEVLRQLNKT